jgi:hypothetical protein
MSTYTKRTRMQRLKKSVHDARYRARNYASILKKQRARQGAGHE